MRLAEFIGFGRKEVIGLDIGSDSVKAVELHKRPGGYSVVAGAYVPVESCDASDKKNKGDNTATAVRKCVEMSGSKVTHAVCAVGGPDAAVRSFTFCQMPKQEIGYAVVLEAEQVSGLDIDNCIVDYQLRNESANPEKICGLLVAAKTAAVQARKDIVKSANLQSVLMDVDCLAILNCFAELAGELFDHTAAILDIEAGYTNLIIMHDESLPFVRNLSHGGDKIVRHIADARRLGAENVRGILLGRTPDSSAKGDIGDSIAAASTELTAEVRETLRYYMTHERKCRIEKIFLCGDFALVDGMDKLLKDSLRMEVEVWNPLKNITFAPDMSNTEALINVGPSMAAVLGLAMRSI